MAARGARAAAGDAGSRILHPGSPEANASLLAAFRKGLGETGYVEGRLRRRTSRRKWRQ
jgi:hypothetical protein